MVITEDEIKQILELDSKGRTVNEIVKMLRISRPTVEKYIGIKTSNPKLDEYGKLYSGNIIENFIKYCETKRGLEINKRNKRKYTKFLTSQKIKQLEIKKDINNTEQFDKLFGRIALFFQKSQNIKKLERREVKKHIVQFSDELADRIILFSYLTGETSIIAGHKEYGKLKADIHEERINSVFDLYLLRRTEIGNSPSVHYNERATEINLAKQTDTLLREMILRFDNRREKLGFKKMADYFDELGENETVRRHLLNNMEQNLRNFEKKYKKIGEKQKNLIEDYRKRETGLSDVIIDSYSPNPLTSTRGGPRTKLSY